MLVLLYQKLTRRKERSPTPSQATKRKSQLPVFIISSIKKIKNPSNKENLARSGSFLKYASA